MVCGQSYVPDDGSNSRLGYVIKANDCGSQNEVSCLKIFDEVGTVLTYSIEIFEGLIESSIRT